MQNILPDCYGNIRFTGEDANGIVCPRTVKGEVSFSHINNANGLVLPKHVSGNLILPNLESTKGLILPEYVGGCLNLRTLKNANGLVLPSHVGKELILCNVTSAKKLVLPKYVGAYLDLSSLKNTTGLEFPNDLGGPIYLDRRTNTELLFLPKTLKANIVYGNLFVNIGGKIFHCRKEGFQDQIPMLRSKKHLGTWLERIKDINMPKWLLVWFLTRQFSEERANDLADTIMAGKMLTS
jgi:hypothetical protein